MKIIFNLYKNIYIIYIICLGPPQSAVLFRRRHGRDYIQVGWNPPNDGGCALTKYILHFTNSSSGQWENITIQASDSLMYDKSI